MTNTSVIDRPFVVDLHETVAAESSVKLARTGSAEGVRVRHHPMMPTSIPRSQLYYWTEQWQEDERAALEELRRGEGIRFPDAKSAIRWLLSEDT
jgi:hypothetical protein